MRKGVRVSATRVLEGSAQAESQRANKSTWEMVNFRNSEDWVHFSLSRWPG